MKIQGPLVVDISLWDDHLNIQELIDGGVVSAIVGIYKMWDGSKYVINTNSKRLLDQVSASSLLLQSYYYYYPQYDPLVEANWFVDAMGGYPVKYAWADCESYSSNMDAKLRSEHHRQFTAQVASRFPNTGVYTAKWYIDEYAPEMNLWIPKYKAWVPHYGHQPAGRTNMSWATLKTNWLPNYDIILAKGQTSANTVSHQFTGDVCILPGVYDNKNALRTLDVSVFTQEFINSLGGTHPVVSHPSVCPTCGQKWN